MSHEVKQFYDFGAFRLDPTERVLLRHGEIVSLTPKDFEILMVLVRNGGHVVEKDQLLDEVWPDAFVEEGNINVHISAIRKVLGEAAEGQSHIQTLPRRGYCFTAPVEIVSEEAAQCSLTRPADQTGPDHEAALPAESSAAPLPLRATGLTAADATAPEVPRPAIRQKVAAAVLLAVLLAAGIALMFFRANVHGRLDHVSFSGNKLLAWDEKGKLAWEYHFSQPLFQNYPEPNPRLIRLVDLNGDGTQELLAAVPFPQSNYAVPRHVLYCFSSSGQVLWTYDPQVKLEFRQKTYEGPWNARDMMVSPGPGPRTIWIAFVDLTWWPSFVIKLDAQGGSKLQFVNSGHINSLEYVENKTGRYLLAAGQNNELKSATLAVMGEDQALAVSPQAQGSIYESKLATPGSGPYRYFVFAPSELFRLRGEEFHAVMQMIVRKDGIEVRTGEGTDQKSNWPYVSAIYEFTPEFELSSASFGDDYWRLHRQMEREGRITHTAEQCPDRNRTDRVRVFAGGFGWSTASLASARANN